MDLIKRKKDLSTNMTHEAAMDSFLGKLGLYRKPIAKDGSCLFRAVAEQTTQPALPQLIDVEAVLVDLGETPNQQFVHKGNGLNEPPLAEPNANPPEIGVDQLVQPPIQPAPVPQVFNCQAEHSRVRKQCIDFMKKNKDKFEAFVEGPFDHHLFNLRSEKEWAGQVEIHAISLLYKCDFLVYQAVDDSPVKATDNGYDKKIMLCYSNGNHYDSVYLFDHKKNLAICQSIVFGLLYAKVFPQLEMSAAEQAESENDFVDQCNDNVNENGDEEGWTKVKSRKQGKASVKNQKGSSDLHGDYSNVPPPLSPINSKFHWEIMRSIDPDGYRNIELEVWEETKKEQQLKDQTVAAAIQFKKGEKCQVKHPLDDQFYTAVIDDIFEKTCKIWIPELKERKVVPFCNLKPNEHGGNSGYRDLTGYHRKTENFGESGSRGNDDQKIGRRRKPNNRRGKGNENFERNPQDGQEEQSGRQRGEKNRRRRNGNPRPKDEKKESRNQGGESGNQDQGFFETSESASFPALPGNVAEPETEKPKPEVGNGNNSAKFWSNFHSAHTSDDIGALNQPSPEMSSKLSEDDSTYENDQVSTEKTTENLMSSVDDNDVTPLEEDTKHVCSHDMQNNDMENHTILPSESKIEEHFEDINDHNDVENLATPVLEQETSPSKINGFQEYECIPESTVSVEQGQNYVAVNDDLCNETNRNFEAIEEPTKLVVEEERLSPSFVNTDFEKFEDQRQETINGVTDDRETAGLQWMNEQVPPDVSSAPLEDHNQINHQTEDTAQSTVLPDSEEPNSNLHSLIANGHVTYSKDPEGKDLPKDMETLRYLYNLGVQTYFYYNNTAYPGGSPLSPVYPVMSPTGAMYTTMHQPYQNQPMLMPHNMCQYPSMQVASQEENRNQHHQNPGEERRDSSGSPGYKQNMPSHHSPAQYHPQTMTAQAMFNYAQMYATGHRPMYPNYNLFPSQPRANYPRYPQNKGNFNRQGNRKPNRYYRNDNQPGNIKLFPVQSGYGSSDSKSE